MYYDENADNICNLKYINEKYIFKAVKTALKYQIKLAANFHKTYGNEFCMALQTECEANIKKAKDKYESYQTKLRNLFEHYATGILEKKEYIEIKEDYTKEQENAKKALEETQKRAEELLDVQRSRIYWAEELIKYQNFDTVTKDLVDRFIDKVIVESNKEITVIFWFGDTFEELSGIKGELSYAV